MVYGIIAKQKNLTAPSCEIPHYMNEKGGWWKMKTHYLEIGDISLAWFILKGIIENFIEYTYENEGDWSIQLSKETDGRTEYFELISENYSPYWDELLSGWL